MTAASPMRDDGPPVDRPPTDGRTIDRPAADEPAGPASQNRVTTRTGLTVALVGTVAVATALLVWVPRVVVPALGAVAGGVALAAALWVLSRWPASPVGTALAGLASLGVGAGLVVGLGGTTLVLVGTLFPVPTPDAVPTASLRVVGLVGVVAGLAPAALGAAVALGGRLEAARLRASLRVSLRTGIVPAGVGAFLLVGGLAGRLAAGARPGPVGLLERATGWLLLPGTGPAGVVGLFVLVLLALLGLRGVLALWETSSGPGGSSSEPGGPSWRGDAALALGVTAAIIGVLAVTLGILGLVAGRQGLTALLGVGTYGGIDTLAATPSLRLGLAAVAGLALGPVLIVRGRAWVTSLDRAAVASLVGTQLAGLLVVVVSALVAEPAVAGLRALVVDKLPGVLGRQFGTTVDRLVGEVGALALALLVVAVLLAAAATLVAGLLLVERIGYLAPATGGVSLAAAGLFGATAFGGAVGAPTAVVVVGIVGSLLVWDAGRLGASLARETGAGAPALEGLHLAASLLVGLAGALVGVAGTVLLAGHLPGGGVGVASLAGALVGLGLLLAALR